MSKPEGFYSLGGDFRISASDYMAQQTYRNTDDATAALEAAAYFGEDAVDTDLFDVPLRPIHPPASVVTLIDSPNPNGHPSYEVSSPGTRQVYATGSLFPVEALSSDGRAMYEKNLKQLRKLAAASISASGASAFSQMQAKSMQDAWLATWKAVAQDKGTAYVQASPKANRQAEMVVRFADVIATYNAETQFVNTELKALEQALVCNLQHWLGVQVPVGFQKKLNKEEGDMSAVAAADVEFRAVIGALPPGINPGETLDLAWLKPDLTLSAPQLFAHLNSDAKDAVQERAVKLNAAMQREQARQAAEAQADPASSHKLQIKK